MQIEQSNDLERLIHDVLAAWEHYQNTGLHLTGDETDAWLAKLEAGRRIAQPKCHR